MFTSVTMVALSGFLAAAPATGPNWEKDYPSARQQGKSERKPLAVFVGSGREGYQGVARDGKLTREVRQLLSRNYVCVYVDTGKEANQRWARAFRMENGIVLSDRTGDLQAFRHEGSLASEDLKRYL